MALLLIAATIVTPLALTAVWLRGEVLVTHRYVHTVTPLASNPAIVSAVAAQITDALYAKANLSTQAQNALPGKASFLGKTLAAGLRSYTQETIERFLRTGAFRVLWIQANTQAHEALVAALEGKKSRFIAADGSVDIDLSNAVLAARTALGVAGIHAFDKVSTSDLQRGIVIARPESLHRVRNGVKLLKALALGLPILALVLYGLAFAISRERRRTLFRAGISLMLAGAAGLLAIVVGRYLYSHHVVGPDLPQAAARALYNTVLSDLRLWFELTALGGALATAAGVIAGPSRAAAAVRGATLRTRRRRHRRGRRRQRHLEVGRREQAGAPNGDRDPRPAPRPRLAPHHEPPHRRVRDRRPPRARPRRDPREARDPQAAPKRGTVTG